VLALGRTRIEKVSLFPARDYYLRALGLAESRAGSAAVTRYNASHESLHISQIVTTRRMIMAKGQQRKNKEAKKPKKEPVPAKVSGNS
jgi:hypothetical protein